MNLKNLIQKMCAQIIERAEQVEKAVNGTILVFINRIRERYAEQMVWRHPFAALLQDDCKGIKHQLEKIL